MMRLTALLKCALGMALVGVCALVVCHADAVREMVITNDYVFEKDAHIQARVVVQASHAIIDGNGATLEGSGRPGDTNSLAAAGIGIFLNGCTGVTIRNLKVTGFEVALSAQDSTALVLQGCDFSRNYHNPKHGWGEMPPRGGIYLKRVHQGVIEQCRASENWNALEMVECNDNLVSSNDFSHCSNTCAKLWNASRNRFLYNNLSYGIRIDRAAGEVHARDSTGVLIESGSDDNYWYRNDVTQGGDGIFIRVLNGWVSRGNVFVENDASYANNNCFEAWSPGNTYIRNKANHGSYGFWLGASDQTVVVDNEAAFNGRPEGYHNAPESGFGHGGIVFVNGPSSHTRVEGNDCHDNNGGGIVFRGDAASKGAQWRAFHWVIQNNRLERNKWGIWGRWADWIHLANNTFKDNEQDTWFQDVSNLTVKPSNPQVWHRPHIVMTAPMRATVGQPVTFDASSSYDPAGKTLSFRWDLSDRISTLPGFSHTFRQPGFHRVGLTVDNGTLADLAFCDLVVTAPVEETGTEGQAALWGGELENNAEGKGRIVFANDSDSAVGAYSLKFSPSPYPGDYAEAVFPQRKDACWNLKDKTCCSFWIKVQNPNMPTFQNAGPVIRLYGPRGQIQLTPAKGGNLLVNPPYSEARWSWMRLTVPLTGNDAWTMEKTGDISLEQITAFGLALDSYGYEPFVVWLDGLAFE